jgi:hypothetical protein
MTTQIDWRETLCQFLGVSSVTDDVALLEQLQSTAERKQAADSAQPSPSISSSPSQSLVYQVIYRTFCFESGSPVSGLYLDSPWVVSSGPQGAHLRASAEIDHLELYLERHKELQFVVYKDYSCCEPGSAKREQPNDNSGSLSTHATSESVCIVTKEFSEALNELSRCAENLANLKFDVLGEFYSPYLWWYQSRRVINEILPQLDPIHKAHVYSLRGYIEEAHGSTYEQVDSLLKGGEIMAEYLSYLYVRT